jgi:DNA-binding CsgD family transcriptional regulator
MNSRAQALWDFLDDTCRATSLGDLSAVTSRYTRAAGFNHYGFAVKFPKRADNDADNYRYFHNIPEPWGRIRYEDTYRSDAADKDPLVQHLRAGLPAGAFSSKGMMTTTRPDIVRRGAPILHRAGDYGLKAGIIVPLSEPNMSWGLMVITTGDTSDVRDVVPALPNFHFFAHYVQCRARLVLDNFRPVVSTNLREREILRWAAVGKTSWEIGRITNLSERTINFHLQSAASKLGVSGRRAACAKAVALGIITL